MAHGTSDWGMGIKTDIYSLVDDLGELPPRLGWPSSVDRRGNVLLMETFDGGGGMVLIDTDQVGDEGVLCSDYARYGRFTYRLTRAADVDAFVSLETGIAAVVTDKIGLESHFFSTTGLPDIVLWLRWRDGTTEYLWGIRWDTTNSKIYLRNDDNTWVEVTGSFPYTIGNGLTHILKLVVDSNTYAYSRAFVDGTPITLPTVAVTTTPASYSPHVLISFLNSTGPAYSCIVYVDALILTRGEQ